MFRVKYRLGVPTRCDAQAQQRSPFPARSRRHQEPVGEQRDPYVFSGSKNQSHVRCTSFSPKLKRFPVDAGDQRENWQLLCFQPENKQGARNLTGDKQSQSQRVKLAKPCCNTAAISLDRVSQW
jgi:hypothetical protein